MVVRACAGAARAIPIVLAAWLWLLPAAPARGQEPVATPAAEAQGERPGAIPIGEIAVRAEVLQHRVVGPNGAGKTTLLRIICGILRPTEGTVRTRGRVACLFGPKPEVLPALSVVDNIFLNASMVGLGLRETRESIDEILSFAELEEHRHSRLEHLSFGNSERLFFGVALHTMRLRRAEIFLFDEWLAGVDHRFREKGEAELQAAAGNGLTTVVASHDTGRLRRMCDCVLYLENGRVRAFGAADEVPGRLSRRRPLAPAGGPLSESHGQERASAP